MKREASKSNFPNGNDKIFGKRKCIVLTKSCRLLLWWSSKNRLAISGDQSDDYTVEQPQNCIIRVVTFDLDNTIWKTEPTIATANDALAAFLDQNGIVYPLRVEKVMGELFGNNPLRYAPPPPQRLDSSTNSSSSSNPKIPKSPVLLTNLRKDAIRYVLEQHNSYSTDDATTLADEAFQVWADARHRVILDHLAGSATSCLQQVRDIKTIFGTPTNNRTTGIITGAITDGNSDPSSIEMLSSFFDFCVNAEQVGVAKPDKRVYLYAMKQLLNQFPGIMADVFSLGHADGGDGDEDLENAIGPWWVHVGDDFIKDVVAAKGLKLRTIWSRELISTKAPDAAVASKPSTSIKWIVRQISEMKVIKMSVGADDYLADSISSEFADAVVDSFIDVAKVMRQWQADALPAVIGHRRDDDDVEEGERNNIEALILASNGLVESPRATPSNVPLATSVNSLSDNFKFCMNCGSKFPC